MTSKRLAENDAESSYTPWCKSSHTPWCKMTFPCTGQSRGKFCRVASLQLPPVHCWICPDILPEASQFWYKHQENTCFWLLCSFVSKESSLTLLIHEPPHDKTNKMSKRPAKTQISLGICPVWSESSLCAQWVAKDPSFLHADRVDSDQTGWMPRLIWVFTECTVILLVLSCRGSHVLAIILLTNLRLVEPLNFFETHYWWFRQTYYFFFKQLTVRSLQSK